MANNKVQLANGTVLIDLTDTTATAEDVLAGKYFYNAAGVKTEGIGSGTSDPYVIVTGEPDAAGGKVLYINGAVNETVTADTAGGDIDNISATVLIDLSDDTVKADKLLSGYTAHDSMGRSITGTLIPPDPQFGTKSITENGTYDAEDDNLDGYSSVTVDVPIPSGYIIPEGSQTITENNTYDVTALASVNVNVPIPPGYIVPTGSQTLTNNGTYDIAQYASVTVSVGGSGAQSKSVSFTPTTSTQTQTVTADTGYDGLSSVDITVNPIPSQYVVPTGELAITSNMVYDVTQYASVAVNVPSSGGGISQDVSGAIILSPDGDSAITLDQVADRTVSIPNGELYLPKATYIYPYTFAGKTDITRVDAPRVTNFKTNYDTVGSYIFYKCSNLVEVNMPRLSGTGSGGYQFASCTKLKRVHAPKASVGQHMFDGDTVLESAVCNGGGNSYGFQNCKAMTVCDWSTTKINTYEFNGCSALTTIILRSTSVVTLSNVNNFNNTRFVAGGAGGTIYIPKVLYDNLGTGSSDYQAATNWSTIHGRGVITWACIEGSQYENYYGDGSGIYKSVSYSLTGCTSSQDYTFAPYGDPWETVLTPNSGLSISSVTVTMAGNDITSTVYNSATHTISIASVSGAIAITASAS